MLRVRLKLLLLITAHLPLMRAEKSHSEETSSISGRDKVKTASCGKDCEDRTRKRSTPTAKCELYYFVPTATATNEDDLFGFWDNKKAEHLEAYRKIVPYLKANLNRTRTKPNEPLFFPAHLPLVEKRKGSDALVLKDVYVGAEGRCGDISEGNHPDGTEPAWFKNRPERLQKDVEMLEAYVERMPRSHWGYRVPKVGENDVCLDDTGLVVKDFPDIRTCFSMWIFDDRDWKPKHFAGRQIYNRIDQKLGVNISKTGFNTPHDSLVAAPKFSIPALFLKETCYVTNELLENRCTYWTTANFYVSLCCCYTNRTECAYRTYKFPSQKKPGDPALLACATGSYYVLKQFGGNLEPKNASEIASSVKEFVQERTSSEFCKWTYTWNTSDETKREDVLRVDLDTEKPTTIGEFWRNCTLEPDVPCCQRTTTLCPLDANSTINEIRVKCVCVDGDLCNKRRSRVSANQVKKFKEARPCEAHTVFEHLLALDPYAYKKPGTKPTEGFMCPVFYNFAHPGRPNTFLQLLKGNNFGFIKGLYEYQIFREHGCHLVEASIDEMGDCPEQLFEQHDQMIEEDFLILICSVEGNPLGEPRTSYPDAELKKTIEANLTAAKAEYPKFVDNGKLRRMYDDRKNGTNENTTTPHCYVEVSFVYQEQYNFTFGEVSIDDTHLHDTCAESVPTNDVQPKCVRRNSPASDEHQRFACCCPRHWRYRQDMCRPVLLFQLKPLLNENVIAKKPEEIMSELKEDPLTKCVQPERSNKAHDHTDVNRPCARNEGCYTGVHARDVPTSTQHKEFRGCVSEYAPDAKKRDDKASVETEARFYRICRLPRNYGQCFAVLGTEDAALPDDVNGPEMVCCCRGRLGSAQKCDTSHQFGMKVGDFN